MLGVLTDFFLLQPQQHGAVERVEARLYLVLVLIISPLAQFHDKGQHTIVFRIVERELGGIQQLQVEF